MAGIGFELNKLAQRDNLWGVVMAYAHAAFASSGPWVFTVLALALISIFYTGSSDSIDMLNFRGVIVYNFSFSLVLAAPVYMLVTRYLADYIHVKDVTTTPSILMESLMIVFAVTLPVALFLYAYYLELPLAMRLAGFANILLIAGVWLLGVFLTALKDYNAVSRAFMFGMAVAVIFAYVLGETHGTIGILAGFDIGLAFTFFMLIARIFAEYPYRLVEHYELRPFYKKYSALAWGGLFYNIGIWIDKWIMWVYAPERTLLESNIALYPVYDGAMFLSYLTIIPSIALFIFSVETNFFHQYRHFYGNILSHSPLKRIKEYHSSIIESLYEGARNIVFLQGTVCLIAILLAPQIFDWLNIQYIQITIFRYGVLGAFFHSMMLFTTIILSYFDLRRTVMFCYLLFVVLNAVLTFMSIQWGFDYYGFGYFVAAVISFAVPAVILFQHIRNLPYHAFITDNEAVQRAKYKFARGSSEPTMNVT